MLDFLLHLEQLLPVLLNQYGIWVYAILFLVIFAETGLVFMFFLPGDSLLLAIGALCSTTHILHLHYMMILLSVASVLGYAFNYYTGQRLGLSIFHQNTRFFKPEYMVKTNYYFSKHGGKTIMLARFIPFVRSFAPFVAGSAHMSLWSFSLYNVLGGVLWIVSLLGIGYAVGNGVSLMLFSLT